MTDWSYKDALAVAQAAFHACVMRHGLRRGEDTVLCSCGSWRGSSPHLWLEHVEETCKKEMQDGQSRVSRRTS